MRRRNIIDKEELVNTKSQKLSFQTDLQRTLENQNHKVNIILDMVNTLFTLVVFSRYMLILQIEDFIFNDIYSIFGHIIHAYFLIEWVFSVMNIIILSASLLYYAERFEMPEGSKNDPQYEKQWQRYDKNYLYYIYFVLTAISTVGYNNIFTNTSTQIVIIVLLQFGIYFVPTKASQLMSLLSQKSIYSRKSYTASERIPHLVLTGVISHTAALDFFSELFHEDHGQQKKNAVMLLPNQPDSQMQSLITNYQDDVIFLQGNNQKEKDLIRCQAEFAKAIIILSNKHSPDPYEEDSKTIISVMKIKQYLSKQKAQQVRFCIQLLRGEDKTHYKLSLLRQQRKNDQIICIDEMKMSLLAKSCLCPGLITVITNLITSQGEEIKKEENQNQNKWLEDY
ncbi:hypothetical protein PPERSA_04189 [Pseudocohnilembus persalinus]|uniref:Potassium channel domain-containing protein n=1 Tax=Pseudocohnilembus persalinus TaxID=266149 RepID=A0A0V0QNU7_PSEPJ|nr:hypothetical protein PPERSA_04189 [Pseudocohnilembus persalinus]|eukprot:KRX03637.1 hypothetical protein PPERSA_04189 [Pseudocohnilembus persalinus]